MPPKRKAAGAGRKAGPKKPPPAKKGKDSTADNDTTANELPSPTESVGPTWDVSLRSLPEAVRTVVDNGPIPGLNSTPISFINPQNWCYRNAIMTIMMYTPQLLAYIRNWHMVMEFSDHQYPNHIIEAINNVAQAYHSNGSTRVKDTEAAMSDLWQLFRGGNSSVQSFQGAIPAPRDAEQEDPAQLLRLMLDEILRQLHDALMSGKDESENIFKAMHLPSFTNRTRCPGTQDGRCDNPNEKQRRELDQEPIVVVRIHDGDDLTLRDCIMHTLRERGERWCVSCTAKKYHTDAATAGRQDRAWKRVRDCPEVLFMQLQRFAQVANKKTKRMQDIKLKDPVAIPDTLDVSEFLEYHSYGEGSIVQYKLRGVASHIGNGMNGGHFVAHVREGQNWWRVDDKGTPSVIPSSIEIINNDGGGKSGKNNKYKSHPYLLIWVKVKEVIATPTRAPVKETANPTSKPEGPKKPTGKEPGKGDGKDAGPLQPAEPTPPDDGGDEEPAEEGKCNIRITLNLGGEQKVIELESQNADFALDSSKDFPVSGDLRIVDDKGKLFTWTFVNLLGMSRKTVKPGGPQIPEKAEPGKAPPSATLKTGGIKRKAPDSDDDETYMDPTDNTYINPGDKKTSKRSKPAPRSSEEDEDERVRQPTRRSRR
jgi:hypothetical protein